MEMDGQFMPQPTLFRGKELSLWNDMVKKEIPVLLPGIRLLPFIVQSLLTDRNIPIKWLALIKHIQKVAD
jgi:hypothetical protein